MRQEMFVMRKQLADCVFCSGRGLLQQFSDPSNQTGQRRSKMQLLNPLLAKCVSDTLEERKGKGKPDGTSTLSLSSIQKRFYSHASFVMNNEEISFNFLPRGKQCLDFSKAFPPCMFPLCMRNSSEVEQLENFVSLQFVQNLISNTQRDLTEMQHTKFTIFQI